MPEPLRIDAADAIYFRKIATSPAPRHLLARAATLDRVAALSERPDGDVIMTVTTTSDGVSTIVQLPDALKVEPSGVFELRIDGSEVELVAIGSTTHPGGLARCSLTAGWSKPVMFSPGARKELPHEISVARVADRWLVVPRSGLERYAWWWMDAAGTRRMPSPIAAGAYPHASQDFEGAIGFTGGALLLVADTSSPDAKGVGSPGRTRAVVVAADRVTELGAPLPWKAIAVPSRIAGGPDAAIVQELKEPAELLLVNSSGIVADTAVTNGLPSSLQFIDDELVAWGAMRPLAGATSDGFHDLAIGNLSGWIVDTRAAIPVVHEFAAPSAAPPGWEPSFRARIGDELCTWGGLSTVWDDAAHHTLEEILAARRPVLGGACVDPRTGTVRLLAADAPKGVCHVLADGSQALLVCDEGDTSTVWLVTADRLKGHT